MPLQSPVSAKPLTIVGDSRDSRVALFQQALISAGQQPASMVEYTALLEGHVQWEDALREGGLVRIESPGRSPGIRRGLLIRGHPHAVRRNMTPVSPAELDAIQDDKGRIVGPTQWYFGFCDLLNEVQTAAAGIAGATFTTPPADIALFFDKRECRQRLAEAGLPVPPSLGQIHSYEDLRSRMKCAGWARLYLKLNHGSAGSGVVAYETGGHGREQAWTSVEIAKGSDGVRLYNSRKIRRYTRAGDISVLVDQLCQHDVHTEAWIPKAGLGNRRLDLRVVVVAGRPTHVVVRTGTSPLTNLHLGNMRAGPEGLMQRMGPAAWQDLMSTCVAVSRLFPRSLHLGLDIAITPGFRRHVVLEVNAFGDLLKDVSAAGMSTYETEVKALNEGWDGST